MTNKKFCPLPWISEAVRNNGDLRVCCHAKASKSQGIYRKDDGSSYNVLNDSLDEARNSSLAKELRLSMLNNETHEVCTRCDQEDKSGIRSRRQYENELWNDQFNLDDAIKLTNLDGSIDTKKIPVVYYDLRFGNLCNLKCRMCGPTDSNQWYNDQVKVWDITNFKDSHGTVELTKNKKGRWVTKNNDYDWIDSPNFWAQLENKVDNIKHLYIVGGEPLLIDKHYELLQLCIDSNVSENIIVEYNSNITNIPRRAWDIWKYFKEINIGASIDGTYKINDYIRHPSRFNQIAKNLHSLDKAEGNFNIWIAYTVQVYNIHHLPEMMKWILSQNFNRVQKFLWKPLLTTHPLHNPKHLNVKILPKETKEWIADEFVNFYDWLEVWIQENNISDDWANAYRNSAKHILDGYINYMMEDDWSNLLPKFYKFNNRLDEIRNEKFDETFVDLANQLKKYGAM